MCCLPGRLRVVPHFSSGIVERANFSLALLSPRINGELLVVYLPGGLQQMIKYPSPMGCFVNHWSAHGSFIFPVLFVPFFFLTVFDGIIKGHFLEVAAIKRELAAFYAIEKPSCLALYLSRQNRRFWTTMTLCSHTG